MEVEDLIQFMINIQHYTHRNEIEFIINQLTYAKETVTKKQFIYYSNQFPTLIYSVYEIYVSYP